MTPQRAGCQWLSQLVGLVQGASGKWAGARRRKNGCCCSVSCDADLPKDPLCDLTPRKGGYAKGTCRTHGHQQRRTIPQDLPDHIHHRKKAGTPHFPSEPVKRMKRGFLVDAPTLLLNQHANAENGAGMDQWVAWLASCFGLLCLLFSLRRSPEKNSSGPQVWASRARERITCPPALGLRGGSAQALPASPRPVAHGQREVRHLVGVKGVQANIPLPPLPPTTSPQLPMKIPT